VTKFVDLHAMHESYDEKIGCLAQLVERRPYKANVGGSTPSAPTKSNVPKGVDGTVEW
jgi:hypothetical protein